MGRAGLKEAHPAGIWCDRSVDGPIIGTLVVVLDRAKNLPNKKKIGKQDPYAVARLAKEAKRTDTDARGGQTPRWDKELRFPVRDSPDYKILKISVFNDDKKTDLIGETTVNVEKILVKGGGTDDGWRVLKCKEKYAGDILVELTFWDMRPKDEPEKKKAPATVGFKSVEPTPTSKKIGGAREMNSGRTQRGRRPLPADPTAKVEESKATRKSRHSYHPGSSPHLGTHHHSHSEPQIQQLRPRSSRHLDNAPPRTAYEAPTSQGFDDSPLEIYDPYNHDNYIPGPYMGRNEPEDDGYGYAPPPPPPAHRMPYPRNDIPPIAQHEQPVQQSLRHHQSVPDWQNLQQSQPINHRHSFDPRTQFAYAPNAVEMEDPFRSTSSRHSRHSGSALGMMHEDDIPPPLSFANTPSSSTLSSRDGPPPPPPPHRESLPLNNAGIDEPNWDNQRTKPPPQNAIHDDLGLPPYEPPRSRPSSSMGIHSLDQVPHPPSLVPGIDPALADELSERLETERRMSFNEVVQPLNIRQIPSKTYHAPQVEEVQDIQLCQPDLLPEERLIERPTTLKKKKGDRRSVPMVKPMPIHGERDGVVPAVGASRNSLKKNSTLAVTPERKPVPLPGENNIGGMPFSPDSYDVINPHPAAALAALESQRPPDKMIMPGSDKVFDPTDVLPPETFAPEPEKKRSSRPPPPVPEEYRRQRFERGQSPQPPRGPRLSLPAPKAQEAKPEKTERNRLQKRSIRASQSMAVLPSSSSDPYANAGDMSNAMVMYDPRSEREREMQMEYDRAEFDSRALVPTSGGENYSYRPSSSRHSGGMELAMYGSHNAAPPVPAKLPMSREDYLLSQEMSMINIGVGDGGRTRRGRGY